MPTISDLESKLGLEHGFLMSLCQEKDNWSFVIKTAAFAEGAIEFSLNTWFDEDIQAKAVTDHAKKDFLNAIGNSFEKRVKLSGSLGLISNEYCTLLGLYVKLRNCVAHHITNHGFTFVNPSDNKLTEALKNLFDQIKTLLGTEIDRSDEKSIRDALFNIIFFSCGQLVYGKAKNETTGRYEFINVAYGSVTLPSLNVTGTAL
jgi:hypothetical protein